MRRHGRPRRPARRPACREAPSSCASVMRPAVVGAGAGRGAAVAGRRGARRRRGSSPTTATPVHLARRRRRDRTRPGRRTRSPTTRPRRRRPSSTPASTARRPTARSCTQAMDLGVRTWGNDPHGSDGPARRHLPARRRGRASRLLAALPALARRARQARWTRRSSTLLGARDRSKDEPGQEVVLDRLLDLLLIATLRAWFAGPDAEAPAWYRAQRRSGRRTRRCACCTTTRPTRGPSPAWPRRPVRPAPPSPGASPSSSASRRWRSSPSWRLALAADLLREPGATVGAVAQQVGYGSPFALSTAFKRHRGVSPRAHRMAVT